MKFPRNAKVFRGQLDVAAFAGVFFALCLMLVFSTLLVHSPGVEIQLPEVLDARVQGVEPPVINVAVDAQGTIYFESQIIERASFKNRLSHVVAQFERPPTLIIQGDANADLSMVLSLCELASKSGVSKTLWATRMLEPAIQTVP